MKKSDIARSREGQMGKRYIPWDKLTPVERVARWESVLRVLKGLTPKQRREEFEMSLWLKDAKNATGMPKLFSAIAKTRCGTSACAAGFCGIDKEFNKQGFVIRNVFQEARWINHGEPDLKEDFQLNEYLDTEWNAELTDFFGVTGSDQIFENGDTRPVEAVIEEIQSYILNLQIAAIEADLLAAFGKVRKPFVRKIQGLRNKLSKMSVNIQDELEEDATW